jgi:rhamnosyltransferase
MKIAAVVILYNPEKNTIENILSYSSFVGAVYAIDNSEKPSQTFKEEISKINNCFYLQDNENKGIAKRLNEACTMARIEGYEWLLTMDQDSNFSTGMFVKYLEKCKFFYKEDVAIFAINYMPDILPISNKPIQVLSTITSGSIVNLSLHQKIGKYNEDLFIDLVDAEYCYRANALHFKIILFADIILNHRIGYIQYGRSLKNFKITPRILHNPIRMYYLVRNSFYMLYKFQNLPKPARQEIKKCLFLLKNNILYHKNRLAVIKNILRGYWDYKHNRMGKFNP